MKFLKLYRMNNNVVVTVNMAHVTHMTVAYNDDNKPCTQLHMINDKIIVVSQSIDAIEAKL